MENKIKHLEMIQGIINRLNSNSFTIKAWAMGLVTALFAFADKDQDTRYALLSYIIIPICWILDGFFISAERQFKGLYEEIAKIQDDSKITFSMVRKDNISKEHTWFRGFKSQTLWPFYGILLIASAIVMYCFDK